MLIGDRYRLVHKLGAGGMGEVWFARDEKLDRAVAVKRLIPDPFLPASYKQRFDAEYRLMLTLQHEHIVQLFDRVDVRGQQYLVMELVEGTSLEGLVHDEGTPLPAPIAAYIADCILDALDLMQSVVLDGARANIVHRDITPQNILLSFSGAVRVADFGVAKLKAAWKESTEAPMFIGKRSYAPPEMYETGYVDHRMDLYSVGVLLYEMLSGQRAFPVDDPLKSRERICRGELHPLAERAPDVPPGLIAVVERLMRRDPADRYQTAQAAREALLDAVPRAQLARPALRDLIVRRFGGSRRPTGMHFSVESYQAAVREADRARVGPPQPILAPGVTTVLANPSGHGQAQISTEGVPQLVYEAPDKWVSDPARPSSSPSMRRPRSREQLERPSVSLIEPAPRTPWVAGLAAGALLAALAIAFTLRGGATAPSLPTAQVASAPSIPAAPPPAASSTREPPRATEPHPAVAAPAQTRTPRPRKEPDIATLSIDTTRPTRVMLDGVDLGITPIRGYALSPGEYQLEIIDVATGARREERLVMTMAPIHLRL